MSIYGLGVVEIPTNLPVARIDEDDQVYRTGRRNTTPSSRRSARRMNAGSRFWSAPPPSTSPRC
jgi:preprotein translocase subunit SecA